MRILSPGQTVTLSEGDALEGVKPIEGRITSVTLFDDLSAQYSVRWWADGEPVTADFSLGELESDDPKYLDVGECRLT